MTAYFIVYNPATFDFMGMEEGQCASPLDLVSHLASRDAGKIDRSNYLDYLQFDLTKRREAMVDTFGLENGAALYVGNQIGRLAPSARVVQADDHRRTMHDIIQREGANPAAVFITAISSNFPAAAAATLVLNRGSVPVILGGIHVSTAKADAETYIRKHCPHPELVAEVRGPGDSAVLREVLDDIEAGALKPEYFGHTSVEDGVWKPRENVEALPAMCMRVRKKVPVLGRLLQNRVRVHPVAPLLGCPYNCSFCSISTLPLEQRRLCTRTAEDFLDELASYQGREDQVTFPIFLFSTDNLLLGDETLNEMLDGIIERKLRVPFMAQISIEVASNERLLERLRSAGALLFEVGFESLDMRNLEHINKHCRHEIEESGLSPSEYYSRQIKKIQDYGISIQGSFIFGLPHDRFDSLEDNTGMEVAQFCVDNHISLMAGCFSAQPGARMFQDCLEAGTFLYGKPGTMDYLRTLCVVDHGEMNVAAPPGVKASPLLVGIMALEALRVVGAPRNALRNALHMASKSYACPTARGRTAQTARIYDASLSFATEFITASLYRDIGERLAASRDGLPGAFRRLYHGEKDPAVKRLCARYVEELG